MNLFEKAKENGILKMRFKNSTGWDLEEFIKYLEEQEPHLDKQDDLRLTEGSEFIIPIKGTENDPQDHFKESF